MDEPIYVIFKVQFDFALEVWFSIFRLLKIDIGSVHVMKTSSCK